LVRLECPTIPNTKMQRGNSDISVDIQEKERNGNNPIHLAHCRDGFYGISRHFKILSPILSAGSNCKNTNEIT